MTDVAHFCSALPSEIQQFFFRGRYQIFFENLAIFAVCEVPGPKQSCHRASPCYLHRTASRGLRSRSHGALRPSGHVPVPTHEVNEVKKNPAVFSERKGFWRINPRRLFLFFILCYLPAVSPFWGSDALRYNQENRGRVGLSAYFQ